MRDFFISYSHADESWAEWVANVLEKAGYSTILQLWDFRPGSNFVRDIHNAILTAEKTILILSPDYLSSKYTESEWTAAFAKKPAGSRLVPLKIKECELEGLLSTLSYIDLVDISREEAEEKILSGVSIHERTRPYTSNSTLSYPNKKSNVSNHKDYTTIEREKFSILHISDTQFKLPNINSEDKFILGNFTDFFKNEKIDSIVVSGDIAFSGNYQEYLVAENNFNNLIKSFSVSRDHCFITPGNHDVDWDSVRQTDDFFIKGIHNEEDIALIQSDPASMQLLSARLDPFYKFSSRFFGRVREWRSERPWRVDSYLINNKNVGFLQLNSAWCTGPGNSRCLLGEYQIREALLELGECDFRFWIFHHPIGSLGLEENIRIKELFLSIDGIDIVLNSNCHTPLDKQILSSEQGFVQIGSGRHHITSTVCTVTLNPMLSLLEVKQHCFDHITKTWVSNDSISIKLKHKELKKDKLQTNPVTFKKLTENKSRIPIVDIIQADISNVLVAKPILILTAVEIELRTVLKHLRPINKKQNIFRVYIGQETYYLGILGESIVIVTMCSKGSMGRDSSILSTQQAVSNFDPKAIIMVGISFGKDSRTQNIGDVLISSEIISYEQQKIGKDIIINRGPIALSGPVLLNRFRQVFNWEYAANTNVNYFIGPLLSGEKLINNVEYKKSLFNMFPQAVGGEMEGAGLYSAAERNKKEWIIVKSICDWADGNKDDLNQAFAADTAVSIVKHVLSNPIALRSL